MWSMCVGARGRERWRWLKPRNPGEIHALPSELRELAVGPSLGGSASGIIIWGKSSPVCHLPCQGKSTEGLPDIALFFSRDFLPHLESFIYTCCWLLLPISARLQHYIDISPSAFGHPLLFICLKMIIKQDDKENTQNHKALAWPISVWHLTLFSPEVLQTYTHMYTEIQPPLLLPTRASQVDVSFSGQSRHCRFLGVVSRVRVRNPCS